MKYARVLRLCTLAALALVIAAGVVQAQTFSVLYDFGSNNSDPIHPSYEGLIAQGRDGNLYSTAPNGGATNQGAVFKITPGGTLTTLYNFTGGNDGLAPFSGLTLGYDGYFYGTAFQGGKSNRGTIYRVTPAGKLTVLYPFTSADGNLPYAPPIQGTDGNLYGTTPQGGANNFGMIYRLTPSGKLKTIYSFDVTHGYNPVAPLIEGTDGNFYGTAELGGSGGQGTVFRISGAGKLTVLHNFGSDGSTLTAPLVQGSDGNFYGTASVGGAHSAGVIFKVTSTGKFTILHTMNGTTDGAYPNAGLVQGTDGNFYGTALEGGSNSNCGLGSCGTVFKITPKRAYSVLNNFDSTTGSAASVTPFQHTNAIVYGDAASNGTGNGGVFYGWKDPTLPAFVSLLPYSGKVGKTIEFLGQGFKGTTKVSFNGTAAAFKVFSDTYLTATVPAGMTTGSVTVTTKTSGTLTSNKVFRVTPQILNFTPTSGKVGIQVTIIGVSLTKATKVTFGGVAAPSFIVDSDQLVTATVPKGAQTGHIAITTTGGVAVSSGVFVVTQ